VTETLNDTEREAALRAAQAAYLDSQKVQDDRRNLVLKARTEWGWSAHRIARVMGVFPGTITAIINAAAARTDR